MCQLAGVFLGLATSSSSESLVVCANVHDQSLDDILVHMLVTI